MAATTDEEILPQLFPTQRISSTWAIAFFLIYFPFGIVLTLIRICITLSFFSSQIFLYYLLENDNPVVKIMNKIFMGVLGVITLRRGNKIHAQTISCNQRSNVDRLILNRVLGIYSEDIWNLSDLLRKILHLRSKEDIYLQGNANDLPMLVFPEGFATSGFGIATLQKKYFVSTKAVQPAHVSTTRPLPIALSTVNSSWWGDLLWIYFSPFTVYILTLSAETLAKHNSENERDFAYSVQRAMAKIANLPVLQLAASDKEEYLKKVNFEQRMQSRGLGFDSSPRMQEMVRKVQEVVPYVPQPVIIKDLKKTNSVDITLTNIFDGIVKFSATDKPKTSTTSKSRSVSSRDDLQTRKALFYESARRRYIEKHCL